MVTAAESKVIKLTPAAIEGLERTSLKSQIHHTTEAATFEGVALGDFVRKHGAPSGEAIRGPKLSTIVIIKASDGYQAVFALPELDPAFASKVVILADRRNGKPLGDDEGPYRLLVPDEKRQARWVRQVTSIEIREVK